MGKNKMIAKSCPKCEMQNEVLRNIVNALWYIRNGVIHRDLNIDVLTKVIQRHAEAHERKLHHHVNTEAIQLLDNTNIVAVASKSCKCGHTFFSSRRAADALAARAAVVAGAGVMGSGGPPTSGDIRRTTRVRRSQTQFYDEMKYQKQKLRSPKKRSLSGPMDDYKNKEKESATARARRRRALRRAQRSPQRGGGAGEGGGGGTHSPLPLRPAQLARAHLILQEINRKMHAVTWHPPNDR